MFPTRPRTRLLFLDFEGVVHPLAPVEELHPHKWFCWLPLLAEMLRTRPEVQLVVHSSWRNRFDYAELRQLLGSLGTRFIGVAPGLPKAQAIASVLKANTGRFRDHVVLDDDKQLSGTPGLNLILCDPSLGLSAPATQASLARWLAL